MLRNFFKKTTGLLGSTVELLDSVIFAAIGSGVIPKVLFKPFALLVAGATLPRPFIEEDSSKIPFRILGYIPAGVMNTAIFFYEGPAAAGFFTVAVSSSFAVYSAEMIYRHCKGEEFTREDYVELGIRCGKTAGIILTLTVGGTGQIFKLIEEGAAIPLVQKIAAGVVGGLSAINAVKGYRLFAKSVCCPEAKVDDDLGHGLLDVQMGQMEEGADSNVPQPVRGIQR